MNNDELSKVYTHRARKGNAAASQPVERQRRPLLSQATWRSRGDDDRHDDDGGRWRVGLSVDIFLGLAIARR